VPTLQHHGILLLPHFPLLALAAALDTFAAADTMLGGGHYRVSLLSLDGAPVVGSGTGGRGLAVHHALAEAPAMDGVFV
jgi:transcriptional regulator GlxA family with amidase domain